MDLTLVTQILADARRQGVDEAQMLDRRKVLLTPERTIQVEKGALERAADILEQMSAAQILGRTTGGTPQDMKVEIIKLLREWPK